MKVLNIVEVLALREGIPAPIMGWYLSRSRDGKHDAQLSLGAPNPDKVNPATLTPRIPNLDSGYWAVPVNGAKINGVPIPGIPVRVGNFATAVPQILMSPEDANRINQQLGATLDSSTQKFYIPCDTNLQLSLTIGGRDWVIDPRDLVFLQDVHPSGLCLSNIQAGPSNLFGTWLLGTTFMKNAYVIMDYAANTVQLAQLR
ncbi:hypothetical protein EVG20_g10913 [Dentipellis fragilis]|uniref:Peptidase A1 domain-containing protein n=1 Tax=Dentipellis fragilis TaxID=205917 RepID=A0A4Y9XMU7_9AGAM|nr:hypothetical protein EVG20_g10913 [Dentipellis fragilis]